jgi:ABC-type antimicrobial peptide transport system permease subunit
VGIVGDVRMRSLTRPVAPMVYRPQNPVGRWRSATLVVRTHSSPLSLVESVRQAIQQIDPAQPVANVRTLDDVVGASVAQRRLTLVLLGSFAAVALLLAAIGLYGVIAYVVTQRTREFGIRFALGATRRDVLQLVLGQGMKLVVIGLVLGVAGAFSLTHLLTKLLYEIKPNDPLTFAGVSSVLLVVALFAAWLPARRAAKVDPMVALRYE